MSTRLARAAEYLRSVNPWVWDVLFGAAVVFLDLSVLLFGRQVDEDQFHRTDALAVLITIGASVPVIWRRRAPLTALTVCSWLVVALCVLNYQTGGTPTAIVVLLYSCAHYATPPRAQAGLVVSMAALAAAAATNPPDLEGADIATTVLFFLVAWIAGNAVRYRNDTLLRRVAEAERRAEIEAERNARAVVEERLRIAQELHDVVAHSMSVIAVQAGVGAHVLDSDPAEARRALDNTSATSRSTLTEMRRLLGVLRASDGGRAASEPAPGLDDLEALAHQVEAAGVPVTLSVDGDRSAVPAGVTLSAYRIVQEALTNVIKHAGSARAAVRVHVEPGAVAIEVCDDGRGLAARSVAPGSGHGIVGMRERVAVYGGSLSAGPRPGGGFSVQARIPFGDAA